MGRWWHRVEYTHVDRLMGTHLPLDLPLEDRDLKRLIDGDRHQRVARADNDLYIRIDDGVDGGSMLDRRWLSFFL